MVYTLRFFPLQNAICFIILTYSVPVLFTFCIQGVLKLKKNYSGAKRLRVSHAAVLTRLEVPSLNLPSHDAELCRPLTVYIGPIA